MRLFVAIFLPENVVGALGSLAVRTGRSALRWVPPPSLHITLKFIGDAALARVPALTAAVESALAGRRRFHLTVAGGSAFPDLDRPRVFWAGMSGDVDALSQTAAAVDAALSAAGVPREERRFTPHLTVARCRPGARCGRDDGAAFVSAAAALEPMTFPVTGVHLVESHLGGAGARYEIKRSFALAA